MTLLKSECVVTQRRQRLYKEKEKRIMNDTKNEYHLLKKNQIEYSGMFECESKISTTNVPFLEKIKEEKV